MGMNDKGDIAGIVAVTIMAMVGIYIYADAFFTLLN